MTKVVTTYNDIDIEYDEGHDVWRFVLRGRERSATTLRKVREAIDKPDPKEETFTPIKAYKQDGYGGTGFQEVTVTSIAEQKSWGGREFWYSAGKDRGKVGISSLFAICPENDALIEKIKVLGAEHDAAEKRLIAAIKSLKNLEI